MSNETTNTPQEERITEEIIEQKEMESPAPVMQEGEELVQSEETDGASAEPQDTIANTAAEAQIEPSADDAVPEEKQPQATDTEKTEEAPAAEETKEVVEKQEGETENPKEVEEISKELAEETIEEAEKTGEVVENPEEVTEEPNKLKEALEEGGDQLIEAVENAAQTIRMSEEYLQNLSSQSLKEILQVFQDIIERGDQQEMYKYSEAIKASFYKALKREKIAAGFQAPAESIITVAETDGEEAETQTDAPVESPEDDNTISINPFAEIERGFKDLYGKYKSLRTSYLQELEHKKDDNLKVKLQIIDEIKSLLEKQEDINRTFPEFRNLQNRWRDSGPIPQSKVKDVYDTYQHYVEMFYDFVKINNELRDLDFKKNLESKEALCAKAEALIQEDNVVNAFAKLQKLHEEWKEFGPVDKEHREVIWERFKAATSLINKKHQAHFEGLKEGQKDNLVKKTALCEKAEEIATREITESNGWNDASKELENLQKEWKTIGFASKKDNQRIYDRFRAACDKFYNRKREYYSLFKDQMTQNMEKKIALCQQAEALIDSVDWKKTTDTLIELQKQWKEIGPVSRKKSEQIWSRFRAACDKFFDNKEKSFGGVDPQYVDNLLKKRAIIDEVNAYVSDGDRDSDIRAMRDFFNRWNDIGFVPFKEKDKIQEQFKEAIDAHFGEYRSSEGRRRGRDNRSDRGERFSRGGDPVRSEREKLLLKFRKKESEIATYENNMGFFASSKNADAFIKEINKKIELAKEELKELEEKIKMIDKQFEQ